MRRLPCRDALLSHTVVTHTEPFRPAHCDPHSIQRSRRIHIQPQRGTTMRTVAFTACVLALLACAASAARFNDDFILGDLQKGAKGLLDIARHRGREEEGEPRVMVRFIVPPSEADNFEDAWLRLEDDVRDKEKYMNVFILTKTKLDNTIYTSYGEWSTHTDVHDHFMSKHFEDFADFVDDHGIRWQAEMLRGVATDLEKDEKGTRRVKSVWQELEAKPKTAHVLIHYHVPPGEGEGFLDAWKDQAEKTIEEEGLRIYSINKAAGDNINFYVCATWESMSDWMDHVESRHVGKFLDYVADKDVEWRIMPLTRIKGGKRGE